MAASRFNELFISVFGTKTGVASARQKYEMLVDHYTQSAAIPHAEAVASYEQRLTEFMNHDAEYIAFTRAIDEKSQQLSQLESEMICLEKAVEALEKQRDTVVKKKFKLKRPPSPVANEIPELKLVAALYKQDRQL